MAVTYQSFTEKKIDEGSSISIASPSGISIGDLLIAVVVVEGNETPYDEYDRWEDLQSSSTGAVSLYTFYRIATSTSETAGFTGIGGSSAYGFLIHIDGNDTVSPINISGLDSGTSSTPTCPTITTTVDNTLILRIFGADHDDINVDGDPTGYPSLYTGITLDSAYGECSGGAAYKAQAVTGATETAAFALTASEEWMAVTVAITPVSAVSSSISSSPSASISASLSSSPSASISSSPSASLSGSPSSSISASISSTPSASISSSLSGTSSISSSISASPSASPSATPSTSLSSSVSASPSNTPSTSISSTPSTSISTSISSSLSSSASSSLSASESASISTSPSSSPSASASSSISATISVSESASPSASASATPSTTDYGTYTGGGTAQEVENTWVNLSHINSETVSILGTDVNDSTEQYDDEMVVDDTITIIDGTDYNFVKKAIVGLPFRYTLQPMRMDMTTRDGTSLGSIKKTAVIAVSFYNTLDAQYGSSLDELKDVPDFESELFTGDVVLPFDGGFTLDDPLYISGNGPFPCVVRAIVPRTQKTGR